MINNVKELSRYEKKITKFIRVFKKKRSWENLNNFETAEDI
jgi:hypothetical protein